MGHFRKFYYAKRKVILISLALCLPVIFLTILIVSIVSSRINAFIAPEPGVIVVDPGHGGIDGGTGYEGLLEKEINLSIAKRAEKLFIEKGFKVVMTRDEDVSLDGLVDSGGSRHLKDLTARVGIINSSRAQLFLSIHVNSNFNNRNADGAVVYYNSRNDCNKTLAYCIQRSLNSISYEGVSRTIHDPRPADYFILNNSHIPGVIAEVAFISNMKDYKALATDEFRDKIAESLVTGIENYYRETGIQRTRIAS